MPDPIIAPVVPPVVPPVVTGTWFTGKLDAEGIGWLQNRGLDGKSADEVAVAAISAHREAQKFLGVNASELVRLPKERTDPAWKGVYERLGKPLDAKDYDFSTVKSGDKALDDSLTAKLRDVAWRNNLSKEAAVEVAKDFVKIQAEAGTADADTRAATIAADRLALDKSWGSNKTANMFIAQQALKKFNLEPEIVNLIESQVGYGKTMNFFLAVGQAMGEDKLVIANTPNGDKVMTSEQASAKIGELKADKEWVKRYQAGGDKSAEFKQLSALTRIQMGITD